MLTAIGFFSVIGGILASKAETSSADDYCIRTTVGSGDVCTTHMKDVGFIGSGTASQWKYRMTVDTANCDDGNILALTLVG